MLKLKSSTIATLIAVAVTGAVSPKHLAWASLIGLVGISLSWLTSEPVVTLLQALGFVNATGQLQPIARVVAKTADYTIVPSDGSGTTFTNRGAAGAVNFTLPAASPQLAGYRYFFKCIADQNLTVTAAAADTLLALNDAAADSLALSTAGQKIGGQIEAFCDGTAWCASVTSVGHAGTVAT